ncbi:MULTISPECIES: DUF6083 domain-containing protein [Streptomyces]|uniref:DUF6083 domain-containing protein n=1 Tax=Streptomyces TaxID=1883 RepID=UPI0004CCDB37|nr:MULTISPECIES: DUF6083 domain-containing protein [Streptomyces]KOT49928.1 hypothetical protein ADK43_35000 [Streptomyces rimosus subsp. rimosus]
MGASSKPSRRAASVRLTCPYCGLPQDQVLTPDRDPVLLEPEMRPLAHEVPAERRWIELSDGKVTVYGVCPPEQTQRCRIEHALACPRQQLPDLWPWLTALREENARKAQRQAESPTLPTGEEGLPDTG